MEGHMINVKESMEREFDRIRSEYDRLLRLKAEIDAIRKKIRDVSVDERDRLRLNVGGKRFEIRSSTVLKNTFFRSVVSGAFVAPDPDGFYFIDRDPEFLQLILNHLRDGNADLSRLDDTEVQLLRREADFYMVAELVATIDSSRGRSAVASPTPVNAPTAAPHQMPMNVRPVTNAFHGFAFELTILKRDFRLMAVSFIAGSQRKLAVEVLYKEGPLEGTGAAWKKLGDFDGQVDKGAVIPINLTQALSLPNGTHSLCLYSPVANNAISVCPRKDAVRQSHAFQFGRTYQIEDGKGNLSRKGAPDEYDFSGDFTASYS
jgi:hypothetical protein